MKKFLKISAITIIVIISALIILPFLFKGKIMQAVKDEANKTLNAKLDFSDVSLSLFRDFPNFSLKIEDLSLSGKEIFEKDTLMAFESFEAGLNLMSVISGDQIKVTKIFLKKAKINAIVLKDGTPNWDIMIPDTTSQNEATNETDTTSSTFALNLKKLKISESTIIYDDRQSDLYAKLNDFNFKLSGDMTADMTDLEIETNINETTISSGGIKFLNKVTTKFSGGINADMLKSIYTFKENSFALNELEFNFDGSVAMPDTNIVLDLKFNTPNTNFKSVLSLIPAIYQKDFDGIKTSGTFNFNGYTKGTLNAMNMPAYEINLNVNKAGFSYPDLPKSIDNINIELNVKAQEGAGDNITANLEKAHLEMAGNPVDANIITYITANDTQTKGKVTGKVDFSSLKDIIQLENTKIKGLLETNMNFDAKLSDIEKEAYNKVKAQGFFRLNNFSIAEGDNPAYVISSADMELSPQYVNVKKFVASSGKSDFSLNGRVDNILNYVFSDEVLTGDFTFNSNQIDIDELTGTESTETADNTPQETTTNTNTENEVVRVPENIKFTLNSNIKRIIYDGMEITDTKGLITLDQGAASIKSLVMKLLGGSMKMNCLYNSKPVNPKADFNLELSNIAIQQLYKQFITIQRLMPLTEYCKGSISGKVSLNTDLQADMMPDYNTLNSSGSISSNSIGITNNSILDELSKKIRIEALKNPTLKNIKLNYEIKNGNLELKPTYFKIKDGDMNIAGTHNLNKNIDFNLQINMPGKYAQKILNKIPQNKTIPKTITTDVKIGGTSDNPKITGISNNVVEGLKEQVKEKVEELKNEGKEKANEILNEAKKQADAIIAEAKKQAQKIRTEAKKAGDKLINEAEKQGDNLISKAGSNPFKKAAAEESKKELIKNARKQADKLNNEADKRSKEIINTAQKKADKINADARNSVNSI